MSDPSNKTSENDNVQVAADEPEDLELSLEPQRKSVYQINSGLTARKTTVSEEQISAGITGNIRDAILEVHPSAYNELFEKLEKAENGEIPLHNAIGKKNAAEGRVISFNVAGSSFAQPLRYEKGLAGKNNIWLTDGTEKVHLRKGEEGHLYAYKNQDGTMQDLESYETEVFSEKRIEEEFGKGGILGYKDIRMKSSADKRKVKYSISGPRLECLSGEKLVKLSGWFNAGDYKIERTREYIYQLGEEQLEILAKDEDFMKSDEPILFTFTGHSRGGVGVVEGAMRIKHLVHEKYPKLANRVRFETLLYDPVPGPESRVTSSVNHAINLKEQTAEMKDAGMDPLDENDHTTVMYSIGCNNKIGFDPMKVLGADTVILTGHSHDEGLKDLEQQFDRTRRKAYINAANGEAYRASGLCEMPKGIYISDENNIMIPVSDTGTVEHVIDRVYTRSDKADNRRIRRITEVCTDMKRREGGKPTMESLIRGFNAHDPFYVRSSKQFSSMRKGFEELLDLLKEENRDGLAIVRKQEELKRSALAYIEFKSGKAPHSNRTQGRIGVAENLLSFLDQTRTNDLKWYADHPLDPTPKINDVRAAYLKNAQDSLDQNMSFMSTLCEKYQKNELIERSLLTNTLSSMMADRFLLSHKEELIPQPFEKGNKNTVTERQLNELVGDGDMSIYEIMNTSSAVNRFVNDMLEKSDVMKVFASKESTMACLDALNKMVTKEVGQKMIKPHEAPVKDERETQVKNSEKVL